MSIKEDIVHEAVEESKDGKTRKILLLSLVLFVCFFAVLGISAWNVFGDARDSANQGLTLAEQVKAACEDPNQAASLEICNTADEVIEDAPSTVTGEAGPQGETGDTGETGSQGPPGDDGEDGPPPSNSQVQRAVALFCSTGRCNGADGRNATASQVALAVRTYCNSNGECRGPAGTPGTDGNDGASGATGPEGQQGPQGPGPTDGQILAAVEAYCSSNNGCRGPQGEPGTDGDDGATGETGVVNVSSNCDAPDGQTIDQVNAAYDPESRTIVLTCTYTPDAVIPDPLPQGGES